MLHTLTEPDWTKKTNSLIEFCPGKIIKAEYIDPFQQNTNKTFENLDHFSPIINMPLPQTRYIGIWFIWGAIWAFVMLNDLILHLGWRMWLGRITNHSVIISRNNSTVSKTPKPSFYFFSFKTISIWQMSYGMDRMDLQLTPIFWIFHSNQRVLAHKPMQWCIWLILQWCSSERLLSYPSCVDPWPLISNQSALINTLFKYFVSLWCLAWDVQLILIPWFFWR